MLKRIATLLLGVALVSLGMLFFVAPERGQLLQVLMLWWPIFLVLAGLVRIAGHLLDRQPRSPTGGMLLAAIGGILLTANLRGEVGILQIAARYWFWLLLAFVAGRVIRQYTHRLADGPRPRAFHPAAIVVMLAIAGGGLGAHWLSNHNEALSRMHFPFRFGNVRDIFSSEYSITDEAETAFAIPQVTTLIFGDFNGDIEAHRGSRAVAYAKLVKRIRAADEQEAREAAQRIHLEILPQGGERTFRIASEGVRPEFTVTLVLELPGGAQTSIDAGNVTGQITLSGLNGAHILREAQGITVSDNVGDLTIQNRRGSVQLNRIGGKVNLSAARHETSLREVAGPVTLSLNGGVATLEQLKGPVQIESRNTRVDLRGVARDDAGEPALVALRNVSDSKITLARIRGAVTIEAIRTRIDASEIEGDLTINSSSERMRIGRVSGALKVTAENGSVEAADLQGPVDIEATRDVTARSFAGPITVTTRLGAINLVLDRPLGADLQATSEHGLVRVTMPEDFRFRLDANTSFGQLRLRGFDYLNVPRRQRTTSVSYGPDTSAPLLNLRSTNGDILLVSSGQALASREQREPSRPPD